MKQLLNSQPSIFENYGVGVGLRFDFQSPFLEKASAPQSIQWVEVVSENYMNGKSLPNTRAIRSLEKVRNNYPVALHGVSLNIGSANDLDFDYLRELKKLVDRIDPIVVSDHLCWTKIHEIQTHDLNPLPYTSALVKHVADKICRVQDFLKRRILIENVSSYLTFETSQMSEAEFTRQVSEKSDSGILLDINNVFVSANNHGFSAKDFLNEVPHHRVGQIHLAGHTVNKSGVIIDTHDQPIREEVWELFHWYGKQFGHASSMVERDGNIPAWSELEKEVLRMRELFIPNVRANDVTRLEFKTLEKPVEIATLSTAQAAWTDGLFYDEATPKGLSVERFEIYENAFWARFEEALSEDFPSFKAALEANQEDWIQVLFDQFTSNLPNSAAHSWSMNELGLKFLENLRKNNHPHLSVAEEDWAKVQALFLSNALPPVDAQKDFSQLATLSESELQKVCLVLHPSVQWVDQSKKIIWYAGQPKEQIFSDSLYQAMIQVKNQVPMLKIAESYLDFPALMQNLVQSELIYGYTRVR